MRERAMFSRLRFRLLTLVVVTLMPVLGLMLYMNINERRMAVAQAYEKVLFLSRQISDEGDHLLQSTRQLLSALTLVYQSDYRDASQNFFDLRNQYQIYTNIGLTDQGGRVLASALPFSKPLCYADREWFLRLRKNRTFTVSGFLIGRQSGKPALVLSFPILDDQGKLKRVLFAGLDLDWLNHVIIKAKLPPGSTLTVIDRKQTILARFPEPGKWVGRTIPEAPLIKSISEWGQVYFFDILYFVLFRIMRLIEEKCKPKCSETCFWVYPYLSTACHIRSSLASFF
ncbi:MAG: cache domain-containing protein [Thermodesulfobacteriota bacterium]